MAGSKRPLKVRVVTAPVEESSGREPTYDRTADFVCLRRKMAADEYCDLARPRGRLDAIFYMFSAAIEQLNQVFRWHVVTEAVA
jgi:hypothetical protein